MPDDRDAFSFERRQRGRDSLDHPGILTLDTGLIEIEEDKAEAFDTFWFVGRVVCHANRQRAKRVVMISILILNVKLERQGVPELHDVILSDRPGLRVCESMSVTG